MMSNSRKKRSAEYDINSFVIPYSIASSARPEKLEYKEIPTPGWRVCPVKGTSQVNGFGDHCEVSVYWSLVQQCVIIPLGHK